MHCSPSFFCTLTSAWSKLWLRTTSNRKRKTEKYWELKEIEENGVNVEANSKSRGYTWADWVKICRKSRRKTSGKLWERKKKWKRFRSWYLPIQSVIPFENVCFSLVASLLLYIFRSIKRTLQWDFFYFFFMCPNSIHKLSKYFLRKVCVNNVCRSFFLVRVKKCLSWNLVSIPYHIVKFCRCSNTSRSVWRLNFCLNISFKMSNEMAVVWIPSIASL